MKKKKELTDGEVKHIAALAKLTLTLSEIKKYQKQLTAIFDYIEKIGEMKTKNVEETSHPSGTTNVFREDEIDTSNTLSQSQALSNTSAKDGYFKIKAIFEQK